MMRAVSLYALASVVLFCIGLHGLILYEHVIRKLLAVNIMGGGVFLLFVALAYRTPEMAPDPVPHAMVLTGIVVAVSVTALALVIARRMYAVTGQTRLPEDIQE
jgi:multicomponent Na+:H+ antiporter subunit C